MTLAELVRGRGQIDVEVVGDDSVAVGGLAVDSRRVRPGDLFFALPGTKLNGWDFIPEAAKRGAVAVVTHPHGRCEALRASLPTVLCEAPARLMALIACAFFGHPSKRMTLVGVTGTNGKTTVTFLLEAMLKRAGKVPGVIGTVSYRMPGKELPAPLTTPAALDIQELLASMRSAGVTHVAMEVSSHALACDRVVGCHWDAAVFTNLGRDHLDFHRDLQEYFSAKSKLVTEGLPASLKPRNFAVINTDDPWGRRLCSMWTGRTISFGMSHWHEGAAHVTVRRLRADLGGTSGILILGSEEMEFRSALVGTGHLANVMAAAAVGWELGLGLEAIAGGIADVERVPGRLESLDEGQPFKVFVDYAHTPDALANVLGFLRAEARRLITVFGCGGDRDRGKRPLMGKVAATHSDFVFLTSDNPRTEDPMRIIEEIEAGLIEGGAVKQEGSFAPGGVERAGGKGASYRIVPERRLAIGAAIALARSGDVVLIAGKGHENYQIVGWRKLPFDDREVAREALRITGYRR